MKLKLIFLWVFTTLIFVDCSKIEEIDLKSVPARGFLSKRPAMSWEESLVSGNGIMGAMVMGHPYSDTIIVNHALLYMPLNKPLKPISQGKHLEEIRSLMLKGQYGKASEYVVELSKEEGWDEKRWTDPLVPAFNLIINMDSDSILEYARTVNFASGELEVKWKDKRGSFSRSTFVSRHDNLIVTRIKSDGIPINCSLELKNRQQGNWWGGVDVRKNTGIEPEQIKVSGNTISYDASFTNQWEGFIKGYNGGITVVKKGGELESAEHEIKLIGADEILILTWVRPVADNSPEESPVLLSEKQSGKLNYNSLLDKHIAIHGEIFNRTKLSLGGSVERKKMPVEEILNSDVKSPDPALIEMEFDAARYNILSASGINPPNLQGIWGGTITPPWSADYTTNGNLPVAVSSMLCTNMPELMLSLFDLLEKNMTDFEVNAKELFNCRGIHVPSRFSSHGLNNHFDAIWPMTFWTGGAGWYSMFYYDYYQFTGDTCFLSERALPFMEKAMLFYEDFLTLGENGKYVFNPSYSPENNPSNIPYQACINATMDVMIAKQLTRNIIAASETMNVNADKIDKWKSMLDKMPPYELNKSGELREWMWPGVLENHSHRHVSHLYSLFDQMDPEFKTRPELLDGAGLVIEEKMKVRRQDRGGVMVFGMTQLAFSAAMIGESEACYDILGWLTNNYWNNNLVTTHDPGALFNLDLSGGYPAVIIKMLMYSEPGTITLFPALPSELKSGSLEGVLARGNVEIENLQWDNKNVKLLLHSGNDQNLVLNFPNAIVLLNCRGADTIVSPDKNSIKLKLKKDVRVEIDLSLEKACYE